MSEMLLLCGFLILQPVFSGETFSQENSNGEKCLKKVVFTEEFDFTYRDECRYAKKTKCFDTFRTILQEKEARLEAIKLSLLPAL